MLWCTWESFNHCLCFKNLPDKHVYSVPNSVIPDRGPQGLLQQFSSATQKSNLSGFATLLEDVNSNFFEVIFKNYIFLYLWVFLCVQVGNNYDGSEAIMLLLVKC